MACPIHGLSPLVGAAAGAAFNMREGGFAETHATHASDRVLLTWA